MDRKMSLLEGMITLSTDNSDGISNRGKGSHFEPCPDLLLYNLYQRDAYIDQQ
jgi:hypothetical protein